MYVASTALSIDDYTSAADGMIEATWISPTFSTKNIYNRTFRRFIEIVLASASTSEIIGTAFAIRHSDACPSGQWHSDDGVGRRFVTCLSEDGSPVNQEFLDFPPISSGSIAVYRKEVHRRPASMAGGRIFLSATLYRHGEPVDLSCPRLSTLFTK